MRRQVLAVPLPRRPLFPAGNRLPVTITDRKLIAELIDLQRGGYAPALPPAAPAGSASRVLGAELLAVVC